jgi:hypothetical protein
MIFLVSDVALVALLIAACVIAVAPFVAFGLGVGYVVGRSIRDPRAAAYASGLVGLLSFWGSLGATIRVLIGDDGSSPGFALVAMVLFLVVLFLTPVFVALARLTYRNRRTKLSRGLQPPV